ncbi:tripartite tricarboxylate transporter TctB family protein [Ectothiorhodospira lacustris]|uniref:tripartite tricarboxylate transporter TctB family protein n=1 Tax=Ectothiorhodospira lacustris TaxID=2899127 RepID=UPI001EE8C4B8|nr:tripartite tricarboxylate transporter TctB family protein [Ectothiorhodospira lacustris]MCG5501331.1 tripartite tricarboxylate transporter TctB family protein [Ectothiorhodospira lacustris]
MSARHRQLVIGLGATAVAVMLLALGLAAGQIQVFIFPLVIAAAMVIFALVTTLQGWVMPPSPPARVAALPGQGRRRAGRLLPGVLVIAAYLAALETAGFFLSSWLTFAAISLIYGPRPLGPGAVITRLLIAAVFMLAVYLLFHRFLAVQTPRGWLF